MSNLTQDMINKKQDAYLKMWEIQNALDAQINSKAFNKKRKSRLSKDQLMEKRLPKDQSFAKSLLFDWLKNNNVQHSVLAKEIGVSRGAVRHWMSGKVRPSLKTILQIEDFTDCAVPRTAWK